MRNIRNVRNTRNKNTVRYYLIIITLLIFLFVTNDFGMLDVQKTAIVMAVGIDREEDDFILTSQIAVPKASTQGKSTQIEQIVSKGKTIASAFKEINAKTGWYPKLVFCHLIILGEDASKQNVFDALDFFLLDEYLSDNCLIATCQGTAQELLNIHALIDQSGSLAMQKVLSNQAQRVGTVLPNTLREFSAQYYGESRSGFLPIISTEPQQENPPKQKENSSKDSSNTGQNQSGGQTEDQQGGASGKPVFSAGETALFVNGKMVGKLNKDETFAFNAVKNKLRLASYETETKNQGACALTIKNNRTKSKFLLLDNQTAVLKLTLTITAGLLDCSIALPKDTADVGDVPQGAFQSAKERLSAQITSAFEKCKRLNCDLFEIISMLQKQEKSNFERLKKDVLSNTTLQIRIRFENVR